MSKLSLNPTNKKAAAAVLLVLALSLSFSLSIATFASATAHASSVLSPFTRIQVEVVGGEENDAGQLINGRVRATLMPVKMTTITGESHYQILVDGTVSAPPGDQFGDAQILQTIPFTIKLEVLNSSFIRKMKSTTVELADEVFNTIMDKETNNVWCNTSEGTRPLDITFQEYADSLLRKSVYIQMDFYLGGSVHKTYTLNTENADAAHIYDPELDATISISGLLGAFYGEPQLPTDIVKLGDQVFGPDARQYLDSSAPQETAQYSAVLCTTTKRTYFNWLYSEIGRDAMLWKLDRNLENPYLYKYFRYLVDYRAENSPAACYIDDRGNLRFISNSYGWEISEDEERIYARPRQASISPTSEIRYTPARYLEDMTMQGDIADTMLAGYEYEFDAAGDLVIPVGWEMIGPPIVDLDLPSEAIGSFVYRQPTTNAQIVDQFWWTNNDGATEVLGDSAYIADFASFNISVIHSADERASIGIEIVPSTDLLLVYPSASTVTLNPYVVGNFSFQVQSLADNSGDPVPGNITIRAREADETISDTAQLFFILGEETNNASDTNNSNDSSSGADNLGASDVVEVYVLNLTDPTEDNTPIEGATVTITSTNQTQLTGSDGIAAFKDLTGIQKIVVEYEDYEQISPTTWNVTDVQRINIYMKMSDDDGHPVEQSGKVGATPTMDFIKNPIWIALASIGCVAVIIYKIKTKSSI